MKSLPPILAALALLLLLLGGYGLAYLSMGYLGLDVDAMDRTIAVERSYSHEWKVALFAPAARAESALRGCEVKLTTHPPYN